MSNEVQFDLDTQSHLEFSTKAPKMVEWAIKYSGGLIKDTTQANYALLVFAIFVFIASYFLVFGSTTKTHQPTPEEVSRMMAPAGTNLPK